jgi:hypothetical protein
MTCKHRRPGLQTGIFSADYLTTSALEIVMFAGPTPDVCEPLQLPRFSASSIPRLLLACLLLILGVHAHAESLFGRVVGVSDGDTVTVLDATKAPHKVRLAGIDAPEKGQPFGQRAKENLSRLVFGKDVRVAWHKKDRYGRLVGTVWVVSPDMTGGVLRGPRAVTGRECTR